METQFEFNHKRSTLGKASAINLDPSRYGTFAEIGAGQEVARLFFQAGKASGTVAKSISAYDMIFSDEIYGKEQSGRYVCQSRLSKMLSKEYDLLEERLASTRGAATSFFAYANTVTTGDQSKRTAHGWMGVKFQTRPKGPVNQIIMHVRMLDRYRLQQQETLGNLGVNLLFSAFYYINSPEKFLTTLVENIKPGQISIDMMIVEGEDTKHLDNRHLNIELVQRGLAEAILFDPKGNIVDVSDTVFSQSLLIQRGSFRPPSITHVDVMNKGLAQFASVFPSHKSKGILQILEITTQGLGTSEKYSESDYNHRINAISSLGYYTLISGFDMYYKVKRFFRRYTQAPMAMIIGASHIEKIFDETAYSDLEGGFLEGLAKLLDESTNLLIYPHKTESVCMTARSYFPSGGKSSIYQFFLNKTQIQDISGCDEAGLYYHSKDVLQLIEKKDTSWQNCVAPAVRDYILKTKWLIP